jgi:hypothetical protein
MLYLVLTVGIGWLMELFLIRSYFKFNNPSNIKVLGYLNKYYLFIIYLLFLKEAIIYYCVKFLFLIIFLFFNL